MPDWKTQWPDIVYKILMAALAIIFGVNQYQNKQQHKQLEDDISVIHQYLASPEALSFHAAHYVYLTEHKLIKFLELEDERVRDVLRLSKEPQYNGVVKPFLAPAVDLGMNGIPVLDQGSEGTCVTFASTASLDAVIGEGDFISQQCSLMLDDALGDNFWNGANMPSEIIDPLQKYGVVSQKDCPNQYPNSSASIDLDTYQSLVSGNAGSIVSAVEYEYFASPNLEALKQALGQGYRVLIGFHIYAGATQSIQGFSVNGNVGGLWACQQGKSPNYCKNSTSGHEVLVIGYDDSQELLKIRNSWGSSVGDAGDYYMTYTFFQAMTIDQTVIK